MELESFWDSFFKEEMDAHHVPGVVFVLVKDGEVVLAKGYGYANMEQQSPVLPDRTLFHLGSIAKVMTAVAAMQLVERGQLDLRTDVNTYLTDFQVPDTYPQSITMAHLLTNSSGLEQHGIDTAARDEASYIPLAAYLQRRSPQRLVPPGEIMIYSSVGFALAGHIVEGVTGMSFTDYMTRYIFQPLGMMHTRFVEPPAYPTTDAAVGYRYQNGDYLPYTDTYYSTVAPGGDFVSTGLDMARFMLMNLEGGRLKNVQFLQEETVRQLHVRQFTHHPRLRGHAYGFAEWVENGQRAIYHDGSAPGFLSRLFLLPEHRMGFFVAYNNGYALRLKSELTSEFLDLYFPVTDEAVEPEPLPSANPEEPVNRFVGYYRDYEVSPSGIGKLTTLINQIRITAVSTNSIRIGTTEYRWVESNLFRAQEGDHYVAFREDSSGCVMHLLMGGTGAFERVRWYEIRPFQVGLLLVFALTFLAAVGLPFFTGLSVQPASLFRWYAGLVCGLNLVFLIVLLVNLMSILENDPFWAVIYGIPPMLQFTLIIPLVTAALTLGLLVLTFLAWRHGYWSLGGRLSYTLVTIAALGFIPFLRYWNLLGWRF